MIGQMSGIARQGAFSDLPSCEGGLALLSQIGRDSHKGIKVDSELKDVNRAKRFSRRLFAQTARHAENFSFLRGSPTPKKVYCEVIDDQPEIYENRFAALCLDLLCRELEAAYLSYRRDASLLSVVGEVGYSRFGNALSAFSFLSAFHSFSGDFEAVSRLRNASLMLKSTPFYSSIKPLQEGEVHSTNALSYDPLYGSLYRLYFGYRGKKDSREQELRLFQCLEDRFGGIDFGKLPVSIQYADFIIRLSRADGGIKAHIENAFSGYSREYQLTFNPGFFYPYLIIEGEGRKKCISLFACDDYCLPIIALCASLPQVSTCPLCGGRISSGDGICRGCGAEYHFYAAGETPMMWAYDLPFAKEDRANE